VTVGPASAASRPTFRGIDIADRYTTFEDKPEFDAVAQQIGRAYLAGLRRR